MRVLFAPDYRAGLPYQELLADTLSKRGVQVSFLSNYRRGFPLLRGTRSSSPEIVHLHWPEKYFERKGDWWDQFRVYRYPLDYYLTARNQPIVLTAHNLLPHNRGEERGVFRNVGLTARGAHAVFVHSLEARRQMKVRFGVADKRLHVIPYGDHAVTMGPPMQRREARARLGLTAGDRICLVFGTVSPYKGTDELVKFWAAAKIPHQLVVVGPISSEEFARRLHNLAAGCPAIDLRLSREWLDENELRVWLSAVDCSIFNYREIFTSGAAALARSYGIPLLIPSRLTAADLMEPHSHVLRFEALDTDFCKLLKRALATPCSYHLARPWREYTSWEHVADLTFAAYRDILYANKEKGTESTSANM
jgi:beta-1,4-mannosyltransferase